MQPDCERVAPTAVTLSRPRNNYGKLLALRRHPLAASDNDEHDHNEQNCRNNADRGWAHVNTLLVSEFAVTQTGFYSESSHSWTKCSSKTYPKAPSAPSKKATSRCWQPRHRAPAGASMAGAGALLLLSWRFCPRHHRYPDEHLGFHRPARDLRRQEFPLFQGADGDG